MRQTDHDLPSHKEPYEEMAARAGEAAGVLRLLANQKRLLVLCRLAERGELPVGVLAREAGLSQSALSQHLARLREDGLVTTRRAGQTVFYRIADGRVARLLDALHAIFCAGDSLAPGGAGASRAAGSTEPARSANIHPPAPGATPGRSAS